MAQRYFATINPGLEQALLEEVREIGGKRAAVVEGGVEFDATNVVFYRAAYRLRCANRLWLRLDEFRARDAPELFNKAGRVEWSRYVPAGTPVEVRGAAHNSRLMHTDRISGAVADAIDAALERPRPKRGQALTVLARVVEDRCTLSLDASGDLLYRRGWKTDAVAAPLRETIAAAMLRLVGWEVGTPVFDPFCGSGTIVIEAAQRAAGVAAGAGRSFDLQRWANFRPELWAEVAGEVVPTAPMQAWGSDVDAQAVDAARHNAARAGVGEACMFEVTDAARCVPPEGPPGWIVTNPPWNQRLADPHHAAFGQLLDTFDARFAGWRLAFLSPRRLQPRRGRALAHFKLGGTPVTLWVVDR